MFDKNSWKRLLYSIFMAMLITMGILLPDHGHTETILLILKGMFSGAIIWFGGELLFPLCERLFPKSVIPGYILLFLLILVGTALFGILFGVESIALLAVMCSAAELCGMGITVFYRRKYSKELNQLLEKKKRGLE